MKTSKQTWQNSSERSGSLASLPTWLLKVCDWVSTHKAEEYANDSAEDFKIPHMHCRPYASRYHRHNLVPWLVWNSNRQEVEVNGKSRMCINITNAHQCSAASCLSSALCSLIKSRKSKPHNTSIVSGEGSHLSQWIHSCDLNALRPPFSGKTGHPSSQVTD